MNITKKFGVDFHSEGGALTLRPAEVTSDGGIGGPFTRHHDSGWIITGTVVEDYFEWVNEFKAVHPTFGRVEGNFETEVHADSEEGFADFYNNHPPDAWDYGDI